MRNEFVRTLIRLADEDPAVVLLTGDLGFMALEPFAERFPDRFFNAGVAEQNMMGVATGLAEAGFRPFVYSIATFAALRAYEFIRNGPVLHGLPVSIAAMGGGFDYGPQGPTHHALEDLAALRALPGLAIVAPADGPQLITAMEAGRALSGPVYYRLSKHDTPPLAGLDGRFALGRAELIREGRDAALIATGTIAAEAVAAAERLAAERVECTVIVAACLAPTPADDLARLLRRVPLAVTVEAHSIAGGLGSLVSEVVAEHGLSCRVLRCGVERQPDGRNGSPAYMHRLHGLDADSLAARIAAALH